MRKFSKTRKLFGALTLSTAMVFSMLPAMNVNNTVTTYAATVTTVSEVEKLESMFTTIDLMDASISDLTKAMEKGEVTAKELVQMYIDRINAYDKSLDLNSIIMINPKALEQAEELDKERAAGKVRGSLHGIPIIVKDNYDVEGLPTSAGCLALKDSIAPDDSYAVKKLKEEGAIILAKANMSEFASSGANSRSTLGGVVHNSYDTERTAAGSSGGTAVAITANFATAGLGTDTGSSIRRPSSFSNLYGLRPSKGLTSIDGVVPLNADRDVTGPICRSAEDLAEIMDAIAGKDESDTYTSDAQAYIPENGYTSYLNEDGLKGKKIGYLSNSFGYYVGTNDQALDSSKVVELDSKIAEMVENAKSNLEKAGAELVDVSDLIPESLITSLRQNTSYTVFEWDLNTYFATLGENAPIKTAYQLINNYTYGVDYTNVSVRNPSESFEDMTDPRTTEGWSTMWNNMTTFRTTISNILKENGIDAVIYVSQTDVADIEKTSNNANNGASYINYFGPVAGLPDMMIPMGMSKTDSDNGYEHEMPLGMSMFSSYGNEETLIEMAYAYEKEAGSSIREMPYTTPALEDKNLDKYLEGLMDKVDSINYSEYTVYPQGKVNAMLSKYVKASDVDTSDVYSTYEAAYDLAVAYDAVMEKLEGNKVTTKPDNGSSDNKSTTTTTTTVTTPASTTVKLAQSKIKSVSRTKSNKKIKISLNKQSKALGYQIKYSTSKKFKAGYTNDAMLTKTNTTLKGLKAKKNYYIKVRAYAVSNGKIVYSKWSKIKTVKVKK